MTATPMNRGLKKSLKLPTGTPKAVPPELRKQNSPTH
jgi:hypothetical protein